ncbi:MAG: FAD-dependent oxidoreductase [Alistipes sp.]
MNRDQLLERLGRERSWDFVVIGGGATGLGIAVDAASRGFRVALLEQADFTKSTSSKSTKLVHGGVRYLAQGDVRLVLEALKERGLMRRNAPHLVKDQSFVIPCYRWWEAPFYGIGLTLYDLMAGRLSFGRSRYLSRKRALEAVPTLAADKLKGGILYHDGQFDDSRMAVNLAQTAVEHGAVAVNYVRVEKLLKTDGRLSGVEAIDLESGRRFRLSESRCQCDRRFRRFDPSDGRPDRHSSGASDQESIWCSTEVPSPEQAVMIPKTDDGRVLFAVPWHSYVVVGTTDTTVERPSLSPSAGGGDRFHSPHGRPLPERSAPA